MQARSFAALSAKNREGEGAVRAKVLDEWEAHDDLRVRVVVQKGLGVVFKNSYIQVIGTVQHKKRKLDSQETPGVQ